MIPLTALTEVIRLALFPGFYLAYLPTTDAFPIYMTLGGLFVLLGAEFLLHGGYLCPGQAAWNDALKVGEFRIHIER